MIALTVCKTNETTISNEEKKLVSNIRMQLLKRLAQFPPLSSSACTGLCKVNETELFSHTDRPE